MLANTYSLPPLLVPQHPTTSSQLDLPAETSVFSSPLMLALLIALGLYLFWTISANRFDETLREDKHSEALTALMAIFTPTKSSWPSDILDATRHASVSRPGRGSASSLKTRTSGSGIGIAKGEIRLRFSVVYGHILNGDLELQSTASVDLVKAMLLERDGVEVDGWKIKVVVEWKWVWRVSLWIVKGLGSRLVNLPDLWNDVDQDLLARAKAPSPRLVYALDSLPTHQHDRFARQLYQTLRSKLSPELHANVAEEGDKHATVTFSTISAPLVLLSTVTLCGLPFFLRVPPAEPTPVLVGLRRAIKTLSSVGAGSRTSVENGRFVVTSIEDTSAAYAGVLSETIKRMEGDNDYRQKSVDELGVRGWRKEMFCLEFEAALYRAGLMKYWEVLVCVS
ncbi:hypothetical protein BJ322DRAFT_548149 [Thelephora terrestris]|uniref:Uncharacterized protein n=1 Tax=Thelephora terrestris TaxID=56493 RepID=A0A9P6LAC0_9AGAM|nr:hypothetical protein BJ322DRAFT_548149 [Thelephora terrestris]